MSAQKPTFLKAKNEEDEGVEGEEEEEEEEEIDGEEEEEEEEEAEEGSDDKKAGEGAPSPDNSKSEAESTQLPQGAHTSRRLPPPRSEGEKILRANNERFRLQMARKVVRTYANIDRVLGSCVKAVGQTTNITQDAWNNISTLQDTLNSLTINLGNLNYPLKM